MTGMKAIPCEVHGSSSNAARDRKIFPKSKMYARCQRAVNFESCGHCARLSYKPATVRKKREQSRDFPTVGKIPEGIFAPAFLLISSRFAPTKKKMDLSTVFS
jgi:hypothetical protein